MRHRGRECRTRKQDKWRSRRSTSGHASTTSACDRTRARRSRPRSTAGSPSSALRPATARPPRLPPPSSTAARPAVWYKLDILDHDPIAFLAAMTRAVRRLHPGFGAALLRELEAGPVLDVPLRYSPPSSAPMRSGLSDARPPRPRRLPRDDGCRRHERGARLSARELPGDHPLRRPHALRAGLPPGEAPPRRRGRSHPTRPAPVRRGPGRRGAGAEVRPAARPRVRRRLLALTEGWPASVVLAGMALEWLDAASLEDALATRGCAWTCSPISPSRCSSDRPRRCSASSSAPAASSTVGGLAERLTGSGSRLASPPLPRAGTRCSPSTPGARGRFATTTCSATSCASASCRTKASTRSGRCNSRPHQALEDCGDRPGAIEFLLGANELELALGVIARGGETELERRPSEQLRTGWADSRRPCEAERALGAGRRRRARHAREPIRSRARRSWHWRSRRLSATGDRDGLYQVAVHQRVGGVLVRRLRRQHRHLLSRPRLRRHRRRAAAHAAQSVCLRPWTCGAGTTWTSASAKAAEFLPRAKPEEAAALRHCALTRPSTAGDIALPRSSSRAATTADRRRPSVLRTLNTFGMIDIALGDYEVGRATPQ